MVTLFSNIGGDCRLLDPFLNHYRRLGVSRIVLSFHLRGREQSISPEVERIVRRHDAVIGSVWHSEGLDHLRRYIEVRSLIEQYCGLEDWVIIADIDEFHVYAGGLLAAIEACVHSGCDYVAGRLIDRVAEGGELRALEEGDPWRQFPIEASITGPILGAADTKIGLARARTPIGPAQHRVLEGSCVACPPDRAFAQVHHFKWDAQVVGRLTDRIATLKQEGRNWWSESQAFLDYLAQTGGRIDLTDPRIEACRSRVFGPVSRARRHLAPAPVA